jgi:hypothetical protein
MILTTHEAEQRAEMRKPLDWPIYSTHPHCSGPCQQGRSLCLTPEACQTGEADDGWVGGTWRDELAFWVAVTAGTFAFCTLLAVALGWRP